MIMGMLAGFGTTVGNAAGPVMGIYLISQGLRKEQFMGTAACFFFIVNAAKLPIYSSLGRITPATLQFDLIMIPIVVVAALVGRRLFSIIPQKVFDPLVLSLAGIAALRLVGVSFFFFFGDPIPNDTIFFSSQSGLTPPGWDNISARVVSRKIVSVASMAWSSRR